MKLTAYVRNPLIVALDVDSEEESIRLAESLSEIAGAFKIGPRLVLKYGESFCQRLAKIAPLFIDCKFFDIPSTMEASVRASFASGASLVTVHALSGQESLTRLAQVERELNLVRPFKILAVTVLTSWTDESVPSNFREMPISDHVRSLIDLVSGSGLSGLVCSPQELSLLEGKDFFIVTPGIRFDLESRDDQKRTMSPVEAIRKGASALVVGRPIIEASDPVQAAMDFSIAIVRGQ